jgi:hypothetical protein
MNRDRAITIYFMDGTKVSFDFPEQAANEAAREMKLEDILKSPYVMVVADGVVLMYPVTNIKSIQFPIPAGTAKTQFKIPRQAIVGATVVD